MAEDWARIPGKDAFGRPETLLVEPRDEGSRVLFATPPAGLLLERHSLDLLIQRLGQIRQGMYGQASGS